MFKNRNKTCSLFIRSAKDLAKAYLISFSFRNLRWVSRTLASFSELSNVFTWNFASVIFFLQTFRWFSSCYKTFEWPCKFRVSFFFFEQIARSFFGLNPSCRVEFWLVNFFRQSSVKLTVEISFICVTSFRELLKNCVLCVLSQTKRRHPWQFPCHQLRFDRFFQLFGTFFKLELAFEVSSSSSACSGADKLTADNSLSRYSSITAWKSSQLRLMPLAFEVILVPHWNSKSDFACIVGHQVRKSTDFEPDKTAYLQFCEQSSWITQWKYIQSVSALGFEWLRTFNVKAKSAEICTWTNEISTQEF